jgi:hypothetical protein
LESFSILALLAAFIAIGVGAVSLWIDSHQWRAIKVIGNNVQNAITEWQGKGEIGTQIGNWLLASEKEGEPSNIDVLSNMVGLAMAKGMRNAYAGEKSGDVRLQKGIDQRVFDAVKEANPELNLISVGLEKLGLGDLATPELLPYAAKALGKYLPKDLLGGQIQQNNGGGQSGW